MMVNTLVGMTSPITIPILFSVLSRLQNNDKEFENVFFKFQKLISIIIIIPLGVGIFVYRNLATEIILGDKWGDASIVNGTWALTTTLIILFGHYFSEVYRAKGKSKLSFSAQILRLVVLVPVYILESG